MATGSILEITTKITSQMFCHTIVSALRLVFCDRVMPQDVAHHQENTVRCQENIVVQAAI